MLIYEEVSKWNEPVTIAILPDHPTPCALKTHTTDPIPFIIYSPNGKIDNVSKYDEFAARKGGYGEIREQEFMQLLLKQ